MKALVNPNGTLVLNCTFEYGLTEPKDESPLQRSGIRRRTGQCRGGGGRARSGTTYHYRVTATNEGGTTVGPDQTFKTLIDKAIPATGGASALQTTATLEGTINPLGNPMTACYFEYGPGPGYGGQAPCASLPGASGAPVPVSGLVGGLTPNSGYHYRLVAVNAGGTVYGGDREFATLPKAPVITTGAATLVGADRARISGTVNPEGSLGRYQFEYGPTTAYGKTTPSATAVGSEVIKVAENITGLQPATTYHYRFSATSIGGTTHGPDMTFTTGPRPMGGIPAGESAAQRRDASIESNAGALRSPSAKAHSCCARGSNRGFALSWSRSAKLPSTSSEARRRCSSYTSTRLAGKSSPRAKANPFPPSPAPPTRTVSSDSPVHGLGARGDAEESDAHDHEEVQGTAIGGGPGPDGPGGHRCPGRGESRRGSCVSPSTARSSRRPFPAAMRRPSPSRSRPTSRRLEEKEPPELLRISLAINRNGHIDYKGLPQCHLNEIQPSTNAEALKACKSSMVGTGYFSANVILPEQSPFPSEGKIYAFNGYVLGHPVIFAHIYGEKPLPTSFVLPFVVRHSNGRYATTLVAYLPKVKANWGSITGHQAEAQS